MVANAVPILFLFLSTMFVGAHPHGDFVEDDDAPHRWLAMPNGKYKCSKCGWVYDPAETGKEFADEPTYYKCPKCGAGKNQFASGSLRNANLFQLSSTSVLVLAWLI